MLCKSNAVPTGIWPDTKSQFVGSKNRGDSKAPKGTVVRKSAEVYLGGAIVLFPAAATSWRRPSSPREGAGASLTVGRPSLGTQVLLPVLETARPGAQCGKVRRGQELTSATVSSFQVCSRKAITESENHDPLLCATGSIAQHLHVGGRNASQAVQEAPRGAPRPVRVHF